MNPNLETKARTDVDRNGPQLPELTLPCTRSRRREEAEAAGGPEYPPPHVGGCCRELFRRPFKISKPVFPFFVGCLIWLIAVSAQAGDGIAQAGDILQFVLPATAAGMTLGFRDKQGALEFGESAAVTLGVTYSLKYAVNERRPNGGSESFPSGHSSISFSSAEFMRKRYGWEYGVPAYAAASFVAYSRVEANAHYPHDVIAGAAIGILSSYFFTKPYKGWHVQADCDGRYFGVRFSRAW